MALATAAGQDLDVQNLTGEESYWQVVQAKSTPFYGAGLEAGAYLGGADESLAHAMSNIGKKLGECVQIVDDLEDVFQVPPNPDWIHGRNNLVLLYGLSIEHSTKELLLNLKSQVQKPENLLQAQQILVSTGAVSYCIYQLVERHRIIRHLIQNLPLVQPDLLASMLDVQLDPIRNLLQRLNIDLPERIFQTN
jgi:geranylgeranyl pyrophosphate synthase